MAAFAVCSLLLTSCSKDEVSPDDAISDNIASLTLGPVLQGANVNRQQQITPEGTPACALDVIPAYAELRLIYGTNNIEVITTVEIGVDSNGDLFTKYSEDLEIPIPSGQTSVSVTLTDFVVYDENDVVIWVAPKEGSTYAQFVTDPLSNNWSLRAGSKNYEEVEVICFDDREVNLYGYQFFDIIPVPLYEFCIFANYCDDDGRHYTADYDFNIYFYDGNREDGKGELIYEEDSPLGPITGDDNGTYWAEPLCIAVPGPGDLASDVPYLVFEATVIDWPNYYTVDGNVETTTQMLTWEVIESLLDRDGDDETTNYWHIFFNCDEEDGPSGNL
ncbi:hypothetical protein [Christiangramia aestuarii]|uniref:hypothetical protein n=1 Tax=Christiangramia aestuarii TaxID=1028746 RepID=UPI0031E77644